MYKAKRDFNSLSLKKGFKKGDDLSGIDAKLIKQWEEQGMAVKEDKPKSKRKTKELKNNKKTK